MSSRLVNVRLDEERLRKARMLREKGVTLSDVIREAIDERFETLNRSTEVRDIRNMIGRIFEKYPDRAGLPRQAYSVRDRKAARAAILQKLRRRAQ